MITVIKRDGKKVPFCENRIKDAIGSAMTASGLTVDDSFCQQVADEIAAMKEEHLTVNQIQDLVENALMSSDYKDVARRYIVYRRERDIRRNKDSKMIKTFNEIVDVVDNNTKNENANINGNTPAGQMMKFGSEVAKDYALNYLLAPEHADAYREGRIHIHDLDYYPTKTTTCLTGDSFITLKDENGKVVNTTLSSLDQYFSQQENEEFETAELNNWFIMSRNGWTLLKKAMRRKLKPSEILYFLKTKKGIGLKATGEHKIPVIRDDKEVLLRVDKIKPGDALLTSSRLQLLDCAERMKNVQYQPVVIKEIIELVDNCNVYDLETADHWFIANNYVVHNCVQIDMNKLLKDGFFTSDGSVREPQSIRAYSALAAIAMQCNQNEQHGKHICRV